MQPRRARRVPPRPIAPAALSHACGPGAPLLLRRPPGTDTAGVPLRAWLAATTLIVLAGCASSGVVPRGFPGPPAAPSPPVETGVPAAEASRVVETALALVGTPYQNGGTDPSGFDCSGFVEYVFAQNGVALPRDVQQQWASGRPVPRTDLRPGDLVFFSITGGSPSHVGIAAGSGTFVHAPSSGGCVRTEQLSTEYWSRRFAGARRILAP